MLFLASWAVLMGPRQYAQHLMSGSRLPFTAAYFGSIALTIYFAIGVSKHLFPVNTSKLSSHQIHIYDVAPALQPIFLLYFDRGVSATVQPSITVLCYYSYLKADVPGRQQGAAAALTWVRRRLGALSHLESSLTDLQIDPNPHGINDTNDSSSSYILPC
jgi:Got1/Sft2-like family